MRKRGRSSKRAMGLIVIIVMLMCVLIMVKTNRLQHTLDGKEERIAQINMQIMNRGNNQTIVFLIRLSSLQLN